MLDVNVFDELRIGLATAEDIRAWSHGEVKKPETINYRTLKPEKDGLFCEKIFGPTRDWECYCGKYKRVRFKGIICERCGVEVTRSKVRRERMGHIELAAPVTHIWFFKGVPSRLGYLLDLAPKDLEKVIYFAAYMITSVDDAGRAEDLPNLQNEIDLEKKEIADRRDNEINTRAQKLEADLAELEAEGARSDARRKVRDSAEREMAQIRKRADAELERLDTVWDRFKNLKVADLEGDEMLYRQLNDRYGNYFEGSMGAAAIQKRLQAFDLEAESESLRDTIKNGKGQRKTRALKRLKVVNAFLTTSNSPEGMVLDAVPVIPPDLRPMVQLDGGRFATSDLNDLYRRVINRNNRLKRLLDLGAPEIIVNNEKRMLQEAVDALFDNGRRGRPVTGPGNRPLKSISDMLKGKQGRFRQNLLGKRVDYSGRSVIVVGPQLKLHQCGLPKQMALELFKPFVMKRLVDLNHAQNIKSAKRMVERARPVVWDVLEEVITEHPVLLNRAPTLHRLGIQAFEPQLVEGKAIHLHPLVCAAFNADFDGDQMAVHLPLSAEAQAEARILMLSSNNILKPSDGRPVTMPSQDMIIGLYHLTSDKPDEDAVGYGRTFSSVAEAIMAFDARRPGPQRGRDDPHGGPRRAVDRVRGPRGLDRGRPDPVHDHPRPGAVQRAAAGGLPVRERRRRQEAPLDDRQRPRRAVPEGRGRGEPGRPEGGRLPLGHPLGRHDRHLRRRHAGGQGPDPRGPRGARGEDPVPVREGSDHRRRAPSGAHRDLDAGHRQGRRGDAGELPGPQHRLPDGRLGCSWQLDAGPPDRRHARPRGEPEGRDHPAPDQVQLPRGPVGPGVLHRLARCPQGSGGHRSADRRLGLPHASSGGRLPGRHRPRGGLRHRARPGHAGRRRGPGRDAASSRQGRDERVLADPAPRRSTSTAPSLGEAGEDVGDVLIDALLEAGVTELKVRSVLTCESRVGTCAKCYGRSLATGKLVDIGEAVGIIAAQSIGEPGTQLTMRTFHTGGVASADDITQGLPRIQELFEARTPKGEGPIAEFTGRVTIDETERTRRIVLTPDDGSEEIAYPITKRSRLLVADGDHVEVGTQLVQGAVDPKKVLRILGPRATQKHLVDEVHQVYRSQGVDIHDKHIEVIVRQMLRRVTVLDSGDTDLLPGELAERGRFEDANRRAVAEGGQPASGRPELMGITKASLATDSWLSAASFQETTRVLTEAAMSGRSDPLLGLKENVILGKLIPAGTGLRPVPQRHGRADRGGEGRAVPELRLRRDRLPRPGPRLGRGDPARGPRLRRLPLTVR